MSYLTPAQLVPIPGGREIAQVATPEQSAVVADVLMELTLTGGDRTAYDSDDVAVADAALARVAQAIVDADALIDGYIGRRYTLPLAEVPGILTTWSRAIARYLLHKDLVGEEKSNPIVRGYRDAVKFLELVAAGKFSLGLEDPTEAAAGGDVQTDAPDRVFTTDSLSDFVCP